MKRGSRSDLPLYILCYALLMIVFGLTIVIFFVWRVALLELISVLNGRSYANRSLYMLGMVGLGVAMFTVVIASEPYLRLGIMRRRLLYRFRRVALPLVIFGIIGLVIQFMLAP